MADLDEFVPCGHDHHAGTGAYHDVTHTTRGEYRDQGRGDIRPGAGECSNAFRALPTFPRLAGTMLQPGGSASACRGDLEELRDGSQDRSQSRNHARVHGV